MHAVEKFGWRKNFKFSRATVVDRQAITRGIANTGHAFDFQSTLVTPSLACRVLPSELKYGR